MNKVLTTVVAGLITLVVAAVVLDGFGPVVVIFGIAGAMIGYLVAQASTRR
jgi:hypothetical protein